MVSQFERGKGDIAAATQCAWQWLHPIIINKNTKIKATWSPISDHNRKKTNRKVSKHVGSPTHQTITNINDESIQKEQKRD